VFAGANDSFRKASETMEEFNGIKLSPNTCRELCQQEAVKMAEWQQKTTEIQQKFINAPGNVEVTIDATKVNTVGGWRDVKVGILSKRPLCKSALPEQWDKRELPDTTVRVAFAAIEKKDRFRNRLKEWRRRLRLGLTGDISVLADGADWIWDISRSEFGRVRECLDVYHALEHLSDTGKVLYGVGTLKYEQWYASSKKDLLLGGFALLAKRLDRLEKCVAEEEVQKRLSIRSLRRYLENHKDRLCYCERLFEGRAIGSGQVEGACKNMIGRRLKQTGARWKVRRLNRMTVLCAVRYCDQWKAYWNKTM
jgi:hypothetical protein